MKNLKNKAVFNLKQYVTGPAKIDHVSAKNRRF